MSFKVDHPQLEPDHKQRNQNGATPSYRAFHEVYITRDFGSKTNEKLITYISEHISEYGGKTADKHGIPLMLFEKSQNAHKFANKLSVHLDIPREHISVKAQKFTR
jgi:hypothetical protein